MTTVDDVIAVARQLSPAEQLEIIQALSRALQQHAEAAVRPSNTASRERVLGLHQGQVWVSDDFNDELPDEFWFGDNNESAA